MLKRYQILLEDWQADFFNFLKENFDISFSEVIRMVTSVGIIEGVGQAEKKYKPAKKAVVKDLVATVRKINDSRERSEKFHKMLSGIYFEARKATEFRLDAVKKRKSF